MPLDKLRGLHRLGTGVKNIVKFKRISSGSAASSWKQESKQHYKFNSAATIELEVQNEFYYTKKNRNTFGTTIGNVDLNNTIDYVVVAGGAGGGTGYGPFYGGGGGAGGGGVKAFHPSIPAPQAPYKEPSGQTLAANTNYIVGGVPLISDNPFNKVGQQTVPFPMTIGSGSGSDGGGGPSSFSLPSPYKNFFGNPPNLSTISVTGGGTASTPGGSGGGGRGWDAQPGGSGTAGQGSNGSGGSGNNPGGAGGGGGRTGNGGGAGGSGGVGGAALQVVLNGSTNYFGAGGSGGGRPGFFLGPPHAGGTPYGECLNGPATAGGGAGNAPAPTTLSNGGGGGGGYANNSGQPGAPGTIIVSFSNQPNT